MNKFWLVYKNEIENIFDRFIMYIGNKVDKYPSYKCAYFSMLQDKYKT